MSELICLDELAELRHEIRAHLKDRSLLRRISEIDKYVAGRRYDVFFDRSDPDLLVAFTGHIGAIKHLFNHCNIPIAVSVPIKQMSCNLKKSPETWRTCVHAVSEKKATQKNDAWPDTATIEQANSMIVMRSSILEKPLISDDKMNATAPR